MIRFWITSLEPFVEEPGIFEFKALTFGEYSGFDAERRHEYNGPVVYYKGGAKIHDTAHVGRGHQIRGGSFLTFVPGRPDQMPALPFMLASSDEGELHENRPRVIEVQPKGEFGEHLLSFEKGESLPLSGKGWFGIGTVVACTESSSRLELRTFHLSSTTAEPKLGEMISDASFDEVVGQIFNVD